jgi:hypothetical protein
MNFRDAEHLSAHLDGQLGPSETAQLESRLAVDAGLSQVLDDLRIAKGLLGRVPRRKAPRNFTLNPLDARVRAPQPRAVPVLRFAGALASLLFLVTVAVNGVAPLAARSLAAAPPPGYGVGGGMGGGEDQVEAPQESLAIAPAGTPMLAAPAAPQELSAPTAEAFAKGVAPVEASAPDARQAGRAPIPALWVLVLAIAAILLGGLSWYLDRLTGRNFRSNPLEK